MLEKIGIRIYSLKVSIIQNQHSYVQFIVFLQFVLGNPPLLKMLTYVKTLSAQIELAITLSERFFYTQFVVWEAAAGFSTGSGVTVAEPAGSTVTPTLDVDPPFVYSS